MYTGRAPWSVHLSVRPNLPKGSLCLVLRHPHVPQSDWREPTSRDGLTT
jgi:hypothetical protein